MIQPAHTAQPPISPATLQEVLGLSVTHVEQEMVAALVTDFPLVDAIGHRLVAAGGKRLRACLTLATSNMGHATHPQKVAAVAAAIELIHHATLLHDDVIDESKMRRGMETANVVWGNKPSILVGDYLLSRAFNLVVLQGHLGVLEILSATASEIAGGELLQLTVLGSLQAPQEHYLKVIEAKTAALFAAACEIGGLLGGMTKEERAYLKAYGHHLGMAFQITDDVLDYQMNNLGKNAGDDFKEGKVTLPLLMAFERASGDEKIFWQRTIEAYDQKEGDLTRALHYIDQSGALNDARALAQSYTHKAATYLDYFADTIYKQQLHGLTTFVAERFF